ncbi:MAG: GNAT family N-acetyltransferase [Bacillota bacterium]|nr:GNAT family N-acetyltransferase [Bacillota bacterium]
MISFREIDKSYFKAYDEIPMTVYVKSHYLLEKIDKGLGGIIFKEIPVKEYIKDFRIYEKASKYEVRFDISNWAFFMAFDNENPIGAVTIVSNTNNLYMLDGRNDISVLWDIRVADGYKQMGIGQKLFDLVVDWSRRKGLKQMKIECQNNNVPACKFYHKQGAVLSKIDEHAYYNDITLREEVQFIWYLDL